MQADKLYSLIESPNLIQSSECEALQSLCAKYPLFQAARFLYLKKLKDSDQMQYVSDLEKYAIGIYDRKRLHRFLYADQPNNRNNAVASDKVYEDIGITGMLLIDESIAVSQAPTVEQDISHPVPEMNFERFEMSAPEVLVEEKVEMEAKVDADADLKTETGSTKENSLPKQIDIIEKFIEINPKIEIDKTAKAGDDISEMSSIESDEIATESLARIYLMQGLKNKAINVYEKLSLKFPEKSAYFAGLINDIKNNITNK